MFVLILTIFVSKSFSSSIRLSEPLVVKTQDGQKYLYHPKLKPAYEKTEQFGNTDYEESKHGCSWSKWGDFSACKPFGRKDGCSQVRERTSKDCKGRYHLDVKLCSCPVKIEEENELEDNPDNFPTDVIPAERATSNIRPVGKVSTQPSVEKTSSNKLKEGTLDSNEETEIDLYETNLEETTTSEFKEVTNSVTETTELAGPENEAEIPTNENSNNVEASGLEKTTETNSEEEIIHNLLNEMEGSSAETTGEDQDIELDSNFFDDETDEMEELFVEDQDYLQNYI